MVPSQFSHILSLMLEREREWWGIFNEFWPLHISVIFFAYLSEKIHKCKRLCWIQQHCQVVASSASACIWKIMVQVCNKNDSFWPQAAHWRHMDLGLPVSHSLWPPRVSVAHSLRTAAIECICWTCVFSPMQCHSQQCYVQLGVFDKCLEKFCPRPLSLLILRYSSIPQTLPHCDTNR